jgi:hypothetical protein
LYKKARMSGLSILQFTNNDRESYQYSQRWSPGQYSVVNVRFLSKSFDRLIRVASSMVIKSC